MKRKAGIIVPAFLYKCEYDRNMETQFENEVLRIIYTRRAVRKFRNQPVSRVLIEKVLDAGRMAPSAINKQPWKFYILTDKEKIKLISKEVARAAAKGILKAGIKTIAHTISDSLHFTHKFEFLKKEDPIFHSAPVVIFLTSPRNNEWAPLDIGMCSQNMMLAAKSLGLETCPVGLGKYVEKTKTFPMLQIPADETVNLCIDLGYGDEDPPVHERIHGNAIFL
jgi:nitroreductase